MQAENYLCVRDKNGKQIHDSQGNRVLECMCGNVLSGRTDPTLPFFTEGGSFWTNSTTKLLAGTRPEDLQSPLRGRCNEAGYESVALIPLRSGEETVGLLQLNDTKPGRFTAEMIRFLEETGASIGIALARVKAEEALRLHEIRLQALLDLNKMTEASEQEILDFVREEIVSITQSKIAFIGFMNEDESVQTTYAWSKEVMRQCAIVETPRQFTVAEAGLWGEAVKQRRPIIINDYAAPHPAKKGIPEGHVPIKRFLCVPVFDGERIVVVAAVANKEKDYDESDVRAFTSMMNDAWRLIRHKQAEQVLQEREDKYRAIFEQAADSIVLIDADSGDLVEFNDKAHENLGYTREEFQKLKIRDFEIIESAEEVAKHIEKIVREGTDAFETKHRTKSGQIRGILVGSRAISIGGRDFILSIWRDITERKQAEEDLRKYRQHLEELVQ
ncbi:MAG: GAF domain-containing protein, partial [Phycisphaerales bacterium]